MLKILVLLVTFLEAAACHSNSFSRAPSEDSNVMRRETIDRRNQVDLHLFMSVDWEGASLEDDNINTMRDFRDQFPEVKLIHFISPSYFTQAGADSAGFSAKFNSVYNPDIDQIGLHVHAWKSLIELAGVQYRDSPQYLNSRRTFPDVSDQGHDVMLNAYTRDELVNIFAKSIEIFGENGLRAPSIFRSGGWLAAPNVLEALADVGITADSSAVPAEFLRAALEDEPLYREVGRIWPEITANTEIYKLALSSGREIDEYTNNLGLADYVDGDQALAIVKDRVGATDTGGQIYAHYGFHQETAEFFSENFFGFIRKIGDLDQVNGKSVVLHFDTPESFLLGSRSPR
jgi:hypothetical protein